GYSRDHRQAWFEGAAFKVRDVASFEPLNTMFARDRLRGYYERIEIAGSDGPSFAMVDEHDLHYARDKQRVYRAWIDIDSEPNRPRPKVVVVPGADPAAFRVPEKR
ncbi:MAG TPA: DKNYY domain-containing protein, partial [Burkholderiaceae bacterium]|nr:DKNYY domain-containing protein [Burkholderiaceae bacterium]